jgi:hypothetical protein
LALENLISRNNMTPTELQVTEFVDRYAGVEFPHAAEVFELFRRRTAKLVRLATYTASLDSMLRENYRYRATRAAASPDADSPSLPADAARLVVRLDAAPDQPIRSWLLSLESGRTYLVFELLDDCQIAGCLETMDRRIGGASQG